MILAPPTDFEYPHIDWHCKTCGEVYCSAGHPDETRCINGHGAGWRPENEQVEAYIDTLESLERGDGIVICGFGPAALMGPVDTVADGELVTEALDSPARKVRWNRDDHVIEWTNAADENAIYHDVYHVETVEVAR